MPIWILYFLLYLFSFRGESQLKKEKDYTLYRVEEGREKGNILFLNGWNMNPEEICRASAICSLAQKYGYNIIVPHMGKSVYASIDTKYTRSDYRQLKKISWLSDSLLPRLQSKGISFQKNGNNHIIGISTGARGAVLFAAKLPDVFQTLILLSGDYDQCIDTNDLLMINTYGHYSLNPKCWKSIDNPLQASSGLKCNVFIGHGKNDKVVKPEHSYLLENKLQNNSLMKSKKIETYFPDAAGHDWKFWREGIERGMEFIKN